MSASHEHFIKQCSNAFDETVESYTIAYNVHSLFSVRCDSKEIVKLF